jgi:hypothetical protein
MLEGKFNAKSARSGDGFDAGRARAARLQRAHRRGAVWLSGRAHRELLDSSAKVGETEAQVIGIGSRSLVGAGRRP